MYNKTITQDLTGVIPYKQKNVQDRSNRAVCTGFKSFCVFFFVLDASEKFLSSQRAKDPKVLFSSCLKMQMKDSRKCISVQLARRSRRKSGPSRSLKPTITHLPHLQAYLTTLCGPWDRKYAFMSYAGQCDRAKSTDP